MMLCYRQDGQKDEIMNYKEYEPTLTPDEAVKLGLMRPISDCDLVEKILQAYLKNITPYYGSYFLFLGLLQVIYRAGFIEGIRSERRKRHG